MKLQKVEPLTSRFYSDPKWMLLEEVKVPILRHPSRIESVESYQVLGSRIDAVILELSLEA